jgi:hypothetical protein
MIGRWWKLIFTHYKSSDQHIFFQFSRSNAWSERRQYFVTRAVRAVNFNMTDMRRSDVEKEQFNHQTSSCTYSVSQVAGKGYAQRENVSFVRWSDGGDAPQNMCVSQPSEEAPNSQILSWLVMLQRWMRVVDVGVVSDTVLNEKSTCVHEHPHRFPHFVLTLCNVHVTEY